MSNDFHGKHNWQNKPAKQGSMITCDVWIIVHPAAVAAKQAEQSHRPNIGPRNPRQSCGRLHVCDLSHLSAPTLAEQSTTAHDF